MKSGTPSSAHRIPDVASEPARPDASDPALPDLNALLAGEQTAIMRAESPGACQFYQEHHRAAAKNFRRLVEQTQFPKREPYTFSGEAVEKDFVPYEVMEERVRVMEERFNSDYSAGKFGTKYNTYEHRSRILRQAKARLERARLSNDCIITG